MYERSIPWPEPERLAALVAQEPQALWLDSALNLGDHAQQSILVHRPLHSWVWDPAWDIQDHPAFWQELRRVLAPPAKLPDRPGFCGGLVGFLTYEAWGAREFFQLPRKQLSMPAGLFRLVDTALVLDHRNKEARLFSWGLDFPSGEFREALARERCEDFLQALEQVSAVPPEDFSATQWTHAMDREAYRGKVGEIREAIHRGDFYQANFCQKFSVAPVKSPARLYLNWRQAAPAPQMALWNLGDQFLLSGSPEILLAGQGAQVASFPIKGTRPRHADPDRDAALEQELQHSAKDRAELLMIVDLVRNDLGRVCRSGSIAVPRLWQGLRFPQVHHLMAEVRGQLRHECDVLDALLSLFPGGSITGAPKLKAMEWIHHLEPFAREIFTGSMGYISWNGEHCWNIAIRSGRWREGTLEYFAGGGIVADSDPDQEYEECLVKARGLEQALKVK